MHNQPDLPQVQPADAARSAPLSASRRQLLRAAASAAPLIATLPSGAAMAQASAFQCLAEIEDIAVAKGPPGSVPTQTPPVDQFIRVDAILRKFRNQLSGKTYEFYEFTVDGTTVMVEASGSWVAPPWSSKDPDTPTFPWFRTGSDPVSLLRLYTGNDSPLTNVITGCDSLNATGWPGGSSPTSPDYCIWPIAKVQGPDGNLGMAASCWASLIGVN